MDDNKIVIEGIIGWDFSAQDFRKATKDKNGELQIEIASPGGFVFDGIEIFNLIRAYSKEKGEVVITINGLCASISSYIALAGNKLFAYDNAVYMIHNVYTTCIGDYRELNKVSKELEALTNLIAKTYANKINIDINEIRKLMDEESYYFGEEILNNGYADGIVKNGNGETSNKDEAYLVAKNRINACFNKIHESEKYKDDLRKAIALMQANLSNNNNNINFQKNNQKDGNIMSINEIKEKYSELYAEIFNLGIAQGKEDGKKEGIELERKRVMAHIKLGKSSALIDKAIDFIEKGKSISDDEVLAEYHSAKLASQNLQNRIDDNPSTQNITYDDIQEQKDRELENRLQNDLQFKRV